MEGGTARYDATPPSDASFLKGWRWEVYGVLGLV